MKKTQILMNKLVYLGLSVIDISKTVMYDFWCDCLKPNMVKIKSFVIRLQTGSLFM